MYIWIWGTPGVRILGWEPHGLNKGTKGQFMSNREARWTDPITARRVPSKWIKGNKGSKRNKGSKGLAVYIQPVLSHVHNGMLVIQIQIQIFIDD
jgi:hypothetical protein